MDEPALSVILAAAGPFTSVAGAVQHLQQQTVANRIELIITTPAADELTIPPEATAKLRSVRLIPLPRVLPIHLAFAAGVPHARANVIVFTEDHVFTEPGWAEALIERHKERWSVVGPVVRNANPQSAASWADFILAYGPWAEGTASGPARMLPGHNSSYKTAVLRSEGDDLPVRLEAESVFHEMLREHGHKLFLENRAVIRHLNFARTKILMRVQSRYARQYAARRSADWSWPKRVAYFLSAPLIPLVRFARAMRVPIALPSDVSRGQVLAILLLDLLVDGAGQAVGYIAGAGTTAEYLTEFEYNRVRFS